MMEIKMVVLKGGDEQGPYLYLLYYVVADQHLA